MRPSICRAGLPAHILALVALMLLAGSCATRRPAPEELAERYSRALNEQLLDLGKAMLEGLRQQGLSALEFYERAIAIDPHDERNRDVMRWLLDHPDLTECSFLDH